MPTLQEAMNAQLLAAQAATKPIQNAAAFNAALTPAQKAAGVGDANTIPAKVSKYFPDLTYDQWNSMTHDQRTNLNTRIEQGFIPFDYKNNRSVVPLETVVNYSNGPGGALPVIGGIAGGILGGPGGAAVGAGLGSAVAGGISSGGKDESLLGRTLAGAGLTAPGDVNDEAALFGPTGDRAAEIYAQSQRDREANAGFTVPTIREPGEVTAQQIYAQGVEAGTITAPTAGTAQTAGKAYLAGPAAGYTAAQTALPGEVGYVAPDTNVQADNMGPAAQTAGVNVGRTNVGPAATIAQQQALERIQLGPTAYAGQTQIGPAAQTAGVGVGRTSVGSEANALRDAQIAAAQDVRNAPSAAQAIFQASLSKIAREQMGLAAQARGAERAGARREAGLAIGQNALEAADRAAAASAQEEQAKRLGAAQLIGGIRTTDVDVAKTTAQLQQQANIVQAQLDEAIASGNTQAINTLKSQQAQLTQQINLANQGASNASTLQQGTMSVAQANLQGQLSQQTAIEQAQLQQQVTMKVADLNQQANSLQAQIDQAIASGNTAAANQMTQQQSQLRLQARQATVNAGLDVARTTSDVAAGNAGRAATVGMANTAGTNSAAAQYAAAQNAVTEANAGRQTSVEQQNIERGVTQEQQNLTRGLVADTANVGNTLAAAQFTAGAENTAATTNAANTLTAQQGNVTSAQQRDIAAGTQAIAGQQVVQSGQAQGAAAATNASQLALDAAKAKAAAELEQNRINTAANEKTTKTVTSIGAGLLPILDRALTEAPKYIQSPTAGIGDEQLPPGSSVANPTSDERAKRDVKNITDADMADLVDKMRAVSFRYKPGVEDGGAERHAGVMAQDLERSPVGAQFVSERPDGIKQVDYGQLATLMAAHAARSAKRRSV